jgi:hypothetical protein
MIRILLKLLVACNLGSLLAAGNGNTVFNILVLYA